LGKIDPIVFLQPFRNAIKNRLRGAKSATCFNSRKWYSSLSGFQRFGRLYQIAVEVIQISDVSTGGQIACIPGMCKVTFHHIVGISRGDKIAAQVIDAQCGPRVPVYLELESCLIQEWVEVVFHQHGPGAQSETSSEYIVGANDDRTAAFASPAMRLCHIGKVAPNGLSFASTPVL